MGLLNKGFKYHTLEDHTIWIEMLPFWWVVFQEYFISMHNPLIFERMQHEYKKTICLNMQIHFHFKEIKQILKLWSILLVQN